MAQDDLGVAGPNTRARSLARALLGLAVLVVAGTVVLLVLNAGANSSGDIAAYVVVLLASLVFTTVGALLGTRVPGNPIGWILTGVGLALGLSALFEQYGLRALFLDPGSLPAARWVASLTLSTEVLMIAPLTLIFLLFPTGSVPSRRWRPVLWVAVSVVIFASVGQLLQRGFPVSGFTNSLLDSHRHVVTAFGVFPARGLYSGILGVTLVAAAATFALSLVALFIRRRGGSNEQRSQIGWLAYVGAAALALFFANFALAVVTGSEHSSRADTVVSGILFTAPFLVLFLGVPIACGISILKYHLYDLDIVVRKTVVFGLLATLFTATYAAVVVGIGALIGHRGSAPLTLAAAVVAAIAFQPVRARARRFADRLVYGRRATPYEVLSALSDRLGGAYSTEDVLPRIARVLVEATGAERAQVWLRLGATLRAETSWPETESVGAVVALNGGGAARLDDGNGRRAFPVEHQGELLGALTVTSSAAEPLTPSGERLVRDVAAQAGLVLRNVRLIEELRASRERLVKAQDEERRKLERNIHDGAQQQLVALAVKLNLAEQLMGRDDARAKSLVGELKAESTEALENLRDLAHGIYPPLLADKGLAAALGSQARKSPVPVGVQADGIGRFPPEIEAAVYFCCLEALQNVAKYAAANSATVRLAQSEGVLTFEVMDDGSGFDPASTGYGSGLQGMSDRLEAVGGSIEVRSAPGRGTEVAGRIPVAPLR